MSSEATAAVCEARAAKVHAEKAVTCLDQIIKDRIDARRDADFHQGQANALALVVGRAQGEVASMKTIVEDAMLTLTSVAVALDALDKEIAERLAEIEARR
jgi:hypothetical protein